MSKRNRLDREKAAKKEQEAVSESARKMLKREPWALLVLKLLALVPFGYSGFFYGGVTVAGVFTGAMAVTEEGALTTASAYVMLTGILLMILGILLSFFKKYIASFISNAVGVAFFLHVAYYRVINFAANRVSSEGDIDLDEKYMLWYYPILIFLFLSLVMAVISVILKIKKKRRERHERDYAPVESIVDMEPKHMTKEDKL